MKEKVSVGVKALLVSYVVTAIILVILALLLYNLHWSATIVNLCIIGTYIIANALGSHMVAASINHQRLVIGLLFGITYFVILLLVSVLVKGAMASSVPELIKVLLVCVGSAVGGSIL